MRCKTLLLSAVAALVLAGSIEAQSIIGTYYQCSTADEGEADFIMNTVLDDAFQSRVDAGEITGWGWVEHQAGGTWRRISTITAADRSAAMTAWGAIVDEIEDEHPNAWHRFNEICSAHDDYVWSQVSASEGADAAVTPTAWVSTYWVCDQAKESRADELMQAMAPVFDKHIAAGHLGGWAWYAHDIGGRFRRLQTVLAADDFDVLDGRDMVISDLQSNHADVLGEFGSICTGHVDYLWGNGRVEGDG